jgi:hypothetical protein
MAWIGRRVEKIGFACSTMEEKMTKIICSFFVLLSVCFLSQPGHAIEPYIVPISEILKDKDVLDDPSPFYSKNQFYKKYMSQEAWDLSVFDPEKSKSAWEKAVGLRAPDLVGTIAPEIKPGKYTLDDKKKFPFDKLMTPYHYSRFNEPGTGGPNHVGYFTEFEVIPTQQLWHALPLAEATLKNMGKTKLDKDGYILQETFEDGYPFPRPSGDHMAQQILYNWVKRRKDCESTMNYDLVVGVNGSWQIDHRGTAHYTWIRTEGRVMMPPYGWFDERARKQEEEAVVSFMQFSPRDMYGNVFSATTYTDPRKEGIMLVYVNMLRRVRKLSSGDRMDQSVGQDISYDDSDGFAQQLNPDLYPYVFKVIDEREFLVPAYTFDVSDYVDSKEKFKWKGLKFERRPVWVIEMNQKDPNYIYSKRVAYFDKETLLPLLWEMYDQKGRLYRTFESVWALVAPMGYYNFIHTNNCDWIDVHSTWSFSVGYPAHWLKRDDLSLKSMMKQK